MKKNFTRLKNYFIKAIKLDKEFQPRFCIRLFL